MCRLKSLPKSLVSKEDIRYFFLASLKLAWLNESEDWSEALETLLLHPGLAYQLKINMVDFYVTLDATYLYNMTCNNKLNPIDFKLEYIQKLMLMPLDLWISNQLLRIFTMNSWDLT